MSELKEKIEKIFLEKDVLSSKPMDTFSINSYIDDLEVDISALKEDANNILSENPESIKRNLHTAKGDSYITTLHSLGNIIDRLEDLFNLFNQSNPDEYLLNIIKEEYDKVFYIFDMYKSNPEYKFTEKENLYLFNKNPDKNKNNQIINIAKKATINNENISTKIPDNIKVIQTENKTNNTEKVMLPKEYLTNKTIKVTYNEIDSNINDIINIRKSKNSIEATSEYLLDEIFKFKEKYINTNQDIEINNHDLLYNLNDLLNKMQSNISKNQNEMKNQNDYTENILNKMLTMRLVQFKDLTKRFEDLVKATASQSEKNVSLELIGERTEVDKELIEKVTPAIEHILRNCIAHGIENEEIRVSKNKNKAGKITIETSLIGNYISININDDGSGLDILKLQEKAKEIGYKYNSIKDLYNIIFVSGVSTKKEVNQIAGKGVGMDVVKTTLNEMGGYIEIETTKDVGTTFKITIPVKQAITNILLLEHANQFYGISSMMIDSVVLIKKDEMKNVIKNNCYYYKDEAVEFIDMSTLLKVKKSNFNKRHYKVIILDYLDKKNALYADFIGDNYEIILKNVGLLNKTNGVVGAAELNNGNRALIINPILMDKHYIENDEDNIIEKNKDYILIVDDSKIVREMENKSVSKLNIKTILAEDGDIAINILEKEYKENKLKPILIITDYEMPNLNGMDMVREIKSHEQFKNIPTIMITSKSIMKYKKEADKVGINFFLGKPYKEELLLDIIKKIQS